MAAMLPASVYGLRVPAGGFPVPGASKFPASFRITMAAIDPSAEPQMDEDNKSLRSTLKIIRLPMGAEEGDEEDEDYDEDDIEAIKARLQGIISDEDMSDEEDSDEETNGGPSDPSKAKAAMKKALQKQIQEEMDEAMELDAPNGVNGKSKGKGKAMEEDDEEITSDEDSDLDDDEPEEFVICTLDPEKNCQQAVDITVGEHEQVYFAANGTYDVYLTGNYVFPPDMDEDEDDSEDEDYDLSPDEDELDISESEEDGLDGLENPRVTEVDTDEEEAPKLVDTKKGKNKRAAEEETSLDDMIKNATNGDEKLSKKQAKKLKKNDGQAAPAQEAKKETPSSDKKKVQFAKNLEQGPTGTPKAEEPKKEAKADAPKTGPRNVGGVQVEDKKVGKGRAAKKGDRIEMRYIGKLKNGKQFDANKKGKPFSFKLGVGEVIKGWDLGVAGICPGGERRLVIPPKLAYGNKALPDIPANSELIFDIKCISVN
ncbi:hypothetical protein M011DRAFT_494709 [Sporormia fimetaria CBS 119925]|uniref:FK506-binding protein n=1 Tax=Sporormia fimetaria CBS 119925 TaxID=1340428 RepID=A0A6A6VBF9_9PLEO|nr:hypothetical protein M011DRAFT_494709 [Sporormia fimetaria CBS 119925]